MIPKQIIFITVLYSCLSVSLYAQQAPGIDWQYNSSDNCYGISCIKQTADSGFIYVSTYPSPAGGDNGFGKICKWNKYRTTEWSDTSFFLIMKVETTADGGYVIAGFCYSIDPYLSGCVRKYSQDGSRQWETIVGQGIIDVNRIIDIKQTPDGSYLLAGTTDRSIVDNDYLTEIDYWVVKLNNSGVKLWERNYGGSSADGASSIAPTPDGGCIVLGYTFSSDGSVHDYHGGSDCLVMRLQANGDLIWSKCFGGSLNDSGSDILLASDGNYIISGSVSNMAGMQTHGLRDAWVAKITIDGNIIWQQCVGGLKDDGFTGIVKTGDGGYALTGAVSSFELPTYNGGSYDCLVSKVSDAGHVEWYGCFGDTLNEYGYSITNAFDGGLVISGIEDSTQAGDITKRTAGWIFKTGYKTTPLSLTSFIAIRNGNGILLSWQTAYETNTKNFIVERSTNGQSFNEIGSVDAAGYSSLVKKYQYTDAVKSEGINYYRLKQVDNNGDFKYSNIVSINIVKNVAAIYPVPTNSYVTIAPGRKLTGIQIFNSSGQLVHQMPPLANNQYYIGQLPQGIYTIRICYKTGFETISLLKN